MIYCKVAIHILGSSKPSKWLQEYGPCLWLTAHSEPGFSLAEFNMLCKVIQH